MPESDEYTDPLVAYRLGAVGVGVQVTVLALLVLLLFRLLPGHGEIREVPFLLILVLAAVGVLGVRSLPWERLFRSGLGLRALYAWSVMDILLITAALAVTGAGRSELFLVYALTTVFFGVAYPPRSQILLLLFTFGCYLGVLGATGWHVGAATVLLRCGVLALVAALGNHLAAELLRHIGSLQDERYRAERWAGLLSTVATAAHRMTLDRDPALAGLAEGIVELGFDAAAVTHFRHLPEEYVRAEHSATADMPGLVRTSGKTVIVDAARHPSEEVAVPLRELGFEALIATPVWVDGWLTGALVGARREGGEIWGPQTKAFELLASEAGLAIENAQRFEETLHTVEQLEELDRLKDDFLATASHEIRTPLTVIIGSGLTLEGRWDEIDDEIRLELLRAMNRNAIALEKLISSLLDFARLGAQSQAVIKQPHDVGELVAQVTGRLSSLFGDRHLNVVADRGLVVEADSTLLERVVENLLSNAAKHTPPHTRVDVSAIAEGGMATVTVTDDGPGIHEEEAVHLGERFYRGGNLNARAKGLGLGLALVREILELHGTFLEIETTPGLGARFGFRLPLVDAQQDGEPITEERPSLARAREIV